MFVIAAVWLLAHLASLSPALEDIDSINFALGLHHYDPALHQPHPPGYPVFIAVGRIALAVIHLVAPGISYVRADALALAIWSAIGGAIAIVAAGFLFREMTSDADRAGAVGFWGALFLAVTPLFWITGLRPMSDMFGLGVALAAQALLLHGACGADLVPASAEASAGHRSLGKGGRSANQSLIIGAAIAGLAAGIRTQTVPLTVPMLLYALFMQRRRGLWLLRPLAAFVVAALAWGIPLLVLTGGVDGYLRALGSQAGEDFAWVDMLWANPSPRAIAVAVYDSFLLPFATPVAGAIVLGVVAIAKLRMLFNDRRALLLLAVAFGPYTVFHLLFQEAANLRYATPLVPAFAFGAAFLVCSLDGRRAWPQRGLLVALPLVVLLVVPNIATGSARIGDIPLAAGFVYGREVHPAFRAIDEMTLQAKGNPPGAVFSHYSLRRPLQAAPTSLPVIEATRTYEWLALADYWLKGGREPLWFLADPTRTDLALIDPQVRQAEQRTEYRWSVGDRPELMGTRPLGVDWYRFGQPAWFAGEGWELTPETAGIARASNKRLYQQPITAYIRRMNEPMAAIIAGRHLGPPTLPSSILDVTIDGMPVESIPIDPAKNGIDFFHLVTLPQGIGPGTGNYAELTIRARSAAAGTPTPEIAVEQFDIQPVSTVMFAFGAGWHEAEYNNRTGLAWRWTSDKADLRIVGPGPVSIQLRGESPMKYVTTPPNVHVRAGDRRLARFHPTADFTWDVVVPADALESSGGIVTIETDQIYLPGQAEGTADARRLGLRIFDTRVRRTE